MDSIDMQFLRLILVEAGQQALAQRGQFQAEIKPDWTPVTQVDQQVEDWIIEQVQQRYPQHQILSEETGRHGGNGEWTWVIDPIDGTRSFATGLPIWGVSIGVLHNDRPAVGGFYLPVTDEMYWGTCEEAYYGETRLVEPAIDPDHVLHFLAVPSNAHRHFEIAYPRVRSLGSTAAHLAYVATGAAVGTLTWHISLWDLAGMLPLLTALHIEVTELDGQPMQMDELIRGQKASRPLLAAHTSLLPLLRRQIVEKTSQ